MADSSENKDNNEVDDGQSSGPQANTIWGSAFVRLSLYILLGFILLATSRYVYLKVTGNYPAKFEEQSIIQYPHLEKLQSDKNKKAESSESKNKTKTDGTQNQSETEAQSDTLSKDGGRRQ